MSNDFESIKVPRSLAWREHTKLPDPVKPTAAQVQLSIQLGDECFGFAADRALAYYARACAQVMLARMMDEERKPATVISPVVGSTPVAGDYEDA